MKPLRICAVLALTSPFLDAMEGDLAAPRAPGAARPASAVLEARTCALCHSSAPGAGAMRDAEGRSVAPHDLWRSTAMANSARDPIWRAAVAAEVAATPSRQREIENKCMRCHTPLAHVTGIEEHDTGSPLHALECGERQGSLALDGVSCTLCHGIADEALGQEASFSGEFRLDRERRLFGPHETPFAMPMRRHTSFTPTHAAHVTESALCATCHTLYTDALAPDGSEVGERFLEQAPYLEWRNSAYSDEGPTPGPRAASCAACHLPTVDQDGAPLRARLARNPGGRDFPPLRDRAPYGRHVLVGGNTLLLSLLRDAGEALGAAAPREAFEQSLAAAREQLSERTASVSIRDVARADGRLAFTAAVENRAGHKLPTGHPTRRAWLRVIVRDEAGAVLFASGATDKRGRIVDAAGEPLSSELAGGPVPAHRTRIAAPDEVALFQGIPADADGAPTFSLLRAARWYVDDRLLPQGWRPDHPDGPATAPVGTQGDSDFRPGRDAVHVEIPLEAAGPLEVQVELCYQSLGARWAAELLRWDAPATETFRALYESADRAPEVLAAARLRVAAH